MIALERLQAVRTIVTHENCPDGTASAILLHDVMPDARIVFAQYGTKALAELQAEPGMLFCDFSPPPERASEFVAAGAIVLDHHKSARGIVEMFGADGIYGDEAADPGVSGAVLAYREAWCPLKRVRSDANAGDFAATAGVRDTWQRSDARWALACEQAEALRFYPVPQWLAIVDPFGAGWEDVTRRVAIGALLVERHALAVKRGIGRAWRTTTTKGTRLVVFEGLKLTSDAAEALDHEADVIVGFGYEVDGGVHKVIFSTRSHTGYDCAALAKHYGGGGHTAAAGFSRVFVPGDAKAPTADPYTEARAFIEGYEALAPAAPKP